VSRAIVLGLFALVALAILQTSGPRVAEAARFTIDVPLSGAQENPAVTNDPAGGFARLVFDDVAKTLAFDLTATGVSPSLVTAAHIHRGAAGVNGPIVHSLSATGFTQVSGTIALSDADIADLRAGNFYINVHTTTNPGGAARGQIYVPGTLAAMSALYRQFVDAGNRGDFNALLGFYSANARLTGGTVCLPNPCVGLAAIRRHFEGILAGATRIDITELSGGEGSLSFRTNVTNAGTRAAGIDRIIVRGRVTFVGSLAVDHVLEFDASDASTARFLAGLAAQQAPIRPPATGDGGLVPPAPSSSAASLIAVVLLAVATSLLLRRLSSRGVV
jgi:hypothetical protein